MKYQVLFSVKNKKTILKWSVLFIVKLKCNFLKASYSLKIDILLSEKGLII